MNAPQKHLMAWSAQTKMPVLHAIANRGEATALQIAGDLGVHEMTVRGHTRDLRVLGVLYTAPLRLTRLGHEIVEGKRSLFDVLMTNNRVRFESVGQED